MSDVQPVRDYVVMPPLLNSLITILQLGIQVILELLSVWQEIILYGSCVDRSLLKASLKLVSFFLHVSALIVRPLSNDLLVIAFITETSRSAG